MIWVGEYKIVHLFYRILLKSVPHSQVRTIPSVLVRTARPISLSRRPPTSARRPTSTSGGPPTATRPPPRTTLRSRAARHRPSSRSPVRTCLTSRARPSSAQPRVVTSCTRFRMRTSRSSVPVARLASLSRRRRNWPRRVSRPELSACRAGQSSTCSLRSISSAC